MINNYLKIAIRNLRKNRVYTLINVLGLTIAIAAILLIFRIVNYELGFNKHFAHYDRIVRVVAEWESTEEGKGYSVCVPIPAMDVIDNTVGQFEAMARMRELWSNITVPNPDGGPPLKKFSTDDSETAFFTEPAFFEIFDFHWLAGNPGTALRGLGEVVLTRSWAEKCFGRWEEAIDQQVLLDNIIPLSVKGVIEKPPKNCDFTFPYLVSYPTLKANPSLFFYNEHWGNCSTNNQIYALLKNANQMEAANTVLAKVGDEEYRDAQNTRNRKHILQPLSDLHYNQELGHSGTHRTGKTRLRVLSFIGLLILIMACFNFINLATAQASLRAKEIGVRKTLGGSQRQLIGQLMAETGVIVAGSLVLGAGLASLSAPMLRFISDVPDQLPFIANPTVWGFLLLVGVAVTLLAGLYPSLTLASYSPVKAIRNNPNTGRTSGATLRKSLVVLQFIIAQALIIGAIITINQLDYIQSKELGFVKDLVYTFGFNNDSISVARQSALREHLLQIPEVESVSLSSDQPLSSNTWATNFRYGSRAEDETFSITLKFVDASYQKTYGFKLLAGNWYMPSDTAKDAVVNHTLLKKLGVANPSDVIGQQIRLGARIILKIVGVVEDFHTHSLHQELHPLLMTTRKNFYWTAGLKVRPGNIAGTIKAVKRVYDEVFPEQVFQGSFLDEDIAQFYEDERRLSATCKGFGLLAILISCLGLLGLAAHAASRRVKEIGIRKVLGASVLGIIGMLSKNFVKLVLIALVVAAPLAWLFMSRWLDNFMFRISIQWWVFLLAGLIALLIAFVAVCVQSAKAALANPVDSLRSE